MATPEGTYLLIEFHRQSYWPRWRDNSRPSNTLKCKKIQVDHSGAGVVDPTTRLVARHIMKAGESIFLLRTPRWINIGTAIDMLMWKTTLVETSADLVRLLQTYQIEGVEWKCRVRLVMINMEVSLDSLFTTTVGGGIWCGWSRNGSISSPNFRAGRIIGQNETVGSVRDAI